MAIYRVEGATRFLRDEGVGLRDKSAGTRFTVSTPGYRAEGATRFLLDEGAGLRD